MKMTAELTKESKRKQVEEQIKLVTIVQQNAENFGNSMSGFTLTFQAIQQ